MACPNCGSSARHPIAPGFWRCIATVDDFVGGPGLTGHHPGPPVISQARICGTRYAEGRGSDTAAQKCTCGTYAIGECLTCGAAVCGDHSGLVDGRRRCGNCLHTERVAREGAQAAARLAQRRREQEAREHEQQERKIREAQYAALPVMEISQVAEYLQGRLDDGPESGYRLPAGLSGSKLQAVLQRIPPTVTVVTKSWRFVDLASRPAWRVGTQSTYVGQTSNSPGGTAFTAVVLFDDGGTAAVGQFGGRWVLRSPMGRAEPWTGDIEAIRGLRASLRQGMTVPAFQPYPYGD